jgi:hypothetical protein
VATPQAGKLKGANQPQFLSSASEVGRVLASQFDPIPEKIRCDCRLRLQLGMPVQCFT